jgi:hypothetical protein
MSLKQNWRELLPYKTQLGISDIKERNKAFHALEIKDRRKEIALDTIELVFTDQIVASNGEYWTEKFREQVDLLETPEELQKLTLKGLMTNSEPCEVCARGAMMLSTIRLGNELSPASDQLCKGTKNNQLHFEYEMYRDMEGMYEADGYYHDIYESNSVEMLLEIFIQVVFTGEYDPDESSDSLRNSNIWNFED